MPGRSAMPTRPASGATRSRRRTRIRGAWLRNPKAVIYGLSGPCITSEERRFFAATDPLGFILFARNIGEPPALRELVERADVPILIDQEGGRVQRLRPPHWRAAPPAAQFGALYRQAAGAGVEAARLNAQLIAMELAALGITV